MKRIGRGGVFFIGAVAFYAAVIGAWAWRYESRRAVRLGSDRPAYLHYDIVEVRLRTNDPALEDEFAKAPPRAVVTRGGEVLTTVAGIREMTLARAAPGLWTARWPVPWNAPAGEYVPALLDAGKLKDRLKVSPFRICRRTPKPLPPGGFVVATLESVSPLATMRVKAPDGTEKDWRGLLDWAQALGANAFLVLGGQSPGLQDGQVWVDTNLKLLPEVAKECRARGLLFGTYAMYSLTMSKTVKLPGYEYGLEIKNSKPVVTRAISLRDAKRTADVADFLKPFADDPNVDFVGLDYIRNALGGYELVDDFVKEMPGVEVPPEWGELTRDERMTWLARKKVMRKDMLFIDAWQWWRARRAALIVKEIARRLGGEKPLWAFTLTWDKGWHHGQDPVMMNDAGVDYDAPMFYEADKAQYAAMLKDWHAYVRRGDVQLVPGDIFDWGLHQKDPAGPAEFGRRLRLAVDGVYADGPARGVFYHDLARLLWGRLGPWGTKGWADEARKISTEVKSPAAPAPEKKT
ncbi:MAG TPA: hypothetical protein VH309_06620 [Elusimicrobiota bacterium]|jgi:hypothetical protein|nr:hypothetical protein [Elusimicrobiota bacterium]